MAATPTVLGRASPNAATATDIISPGSPERTGCTFAVHIVNQNTSTATVKLGISSVSATFQASGYLLYNYEIPAGEYLQVTGLALDTEYLVYQSDIASTSCMAMGVNVP